jgi:hypothetical protein
MSEVFLSGTTLPEAGSSEVSRSMFNGEVETLREALRHTRPGTYEFDAQLPELVGYVPEDERSFFDELPFTVIDNIKEVKQIPIGTFSWVNWPTEYAGIKQIIQEDLARLDIDNNDYHDHLLVDMDKNTRFVPKHIDGGLNTPNQAASVFYLFSNRNSTIFYKGHGTFFWGLGLNLRDGQFSEENGIQAPDYGIVRCTHATIHASDHIKNTSGITASFARIAFVIE